LLLRQDHRARTLNLCLPGVCLARRIIAH
jgi:hypothetical protein